MEIETVDQNLGASSNLANQLSKVVFENNEEFGRILTEFCTVHAQVRRYVYKDGMVSMLELVLIVIKTVRVLNALHIYFSMDKIGYGTGYCSTLH